MIPEPKIFYLEYSLFKEVDFRNEDLSQVFKIIYYRGTIDAHCPSCSKESVLNHIENADWLPVEINDEYLPVEPVYSAGSYISKEEFVKDFLSNRKFVLKEFKCSRCSNIHLFYFEINRKKDQFILKKIGQSFSIADYQNHDIKKYKKVLSNELQSEFTKGVGLFSHGVGIGSFVYLRRIIEKFVIQEAYIKESQNENFDKQLFEKSRMKERIDLLKNSLPGFLVANKALYSILSKGIHELSEQECLEIFPVMKTAIEYILDEVKAKRELEEKKKQLSDQISKINEQLGKVE